MVNILLRVFAVYHPDLVLALSYLSSHCAVIFYTKTKKGRSRGGKRDFSCCLHANFWRKFSSPTQIQPEGEVERERENQWNLSPFFHIRNLFILYTFYLLSTLLAIAEIRREKYLKRERESERGSDPMCASQFISIFLFTFHLLRFSKFLLIISFPSTLLQP